IVRAHQQSTRCTIHIANRRSVYFSREFRNRIGITALLAREGVGRISEEKRELEEENGKDERHSRSQAQEDSKDGTLTTLNNNHPQRERARLRSSGL